MDLTIPQVDRFKLEIQQVQQQLQFDRQENAKLRNQLISLNRQIEEEQEAKRKRLETVQSISLKLHALLLMVAKNEQQSENQSEVETRKSRMIPEKPWF
jgi:hypothetical protein